MPRRRSGDISSRSSHSLNSGYDAEAALTESTPLPPSPVAGVLGVSSVDDIIDDDVEVSKVTNEVGYV